MTIEQYNTNHADENESDFKKCVCGEMIDINKELCSDCDKYFTDIKKFIVDTSVNEPDFIFFMYPESVYIYLSKFVPSHSSAKTLVIEPHMWEYITTSVAGIILDRISEGVKYHIVDTSKLISIFNI